MAQATTIEERTEKFISIYNKLKDNGLLPDNETLARELGYKSDASISEILGRRQNIPPKKWALFLEKWRIAKDLAEASTELSEEGGSGYFTADQLFRMYMKAMERQDIIMDAQTIILRSIESKMATEATQTVIAGKVDSVIASLNDAKQVEILAAQYRKSQYDDLSERLTP